MDWRLPCCTLIGFAAAIAGVAVVRAPAIGPATDRVERGAIAQMARADLPRAGGDGSTSPRVLRRAEDGLFYLTARVDHVPVRFIVDTGANVTVLSAADARRVAWRSDQLAGTGRLTTAGGSAAMRWARVDRFEIAGRTMAGVDAVLPGSGASASLLGQNVLSQLGSVTQRGDRLTIE